MTSNHQHARPMPVMAFTSQDTAYSSAAPSIKSATSNDHNNPTPPATRAHEPISGFASQHLTGVLMDLASIMSMMLFVGYSCLIQVNNGKSISPGSAGYYLLIVSKYVSTIFTSLFATVVSNALYNFTAWRIQSKSGISLGTVSRFLGSQSIFGAISTQFSFGLRSYLAFFLIFVWCLSPLGSQASLHAVYSSVSKTHSPLLITALNSFSTTYYEGADALSYATSTSQPMMVASMLAYDFLLKGNQDLWGNIRIPAIEYLNFTGSEYDWIDLATQETPNYYSSLIGMPIQNFPDNGTTKFVYNGSYIAFDCYDISSYDIAMGFTNMTDNISKDDGSVHCGWWSSETSTGIQLALSKQNCQDNFPLLTNVSWPRTQLVWESLLAGSNNMTRANCTLTTSYVDTELECSRQKTGNSSETINCSALRARRSPSNKYRNSNITVLDIGGGTGYGTAEFLASLFPGALYNGGINPLVNFIRAPSFAVSSSKTDIYNWDLSTVPKEKFEQGLMQLFNTANYVGISFNASIFVSSTYSNLTDFDCNYFKRCTMTLPAVNTMSTPVLGVSVPWLLSIFSTSIIGLVFALLGLTFRYLAVAPRSFSPISWLFLPNRLGGIQGVSSWAADNWVKENQETMLFMGDIEPSAEIGQIALTTNKESEPLGQITKDRLYR